jgi:hypothetical protein
MEVFKLEGRDVIINFSESIPPVKATVVWHDSAFVAVMTYDSQTYIVYPVHRIWDMVVLPSSSGGN